MTVRLQVFSWISFPRAPQYPIKSIANFRKFVFIAVVVDTGDKLFTGDNDRPMI
jgi:hypothetical protein